MTETETPQRLDERKRIWTALAALYLDGDLNERDIQEIARTIQSSSFTLEEVMEIDKFEIYPVLRNVFLKTDSGVVSGLDEAWLTEKISARKNNTKLGKWWLEVSYVFYCTLYMRHWKRIKKAMKGYIQR